MPAIHGRVVLIIQRRWYIASALAVAFEAKGAKVVMTRSYDPDLANISNLAAAVLDSSSRDLCAQLRARGIPFVLYTARVDHECDAAAIIQKPAPPSEVVARVEEALTRS
jgi:DNA-binding response OmpR family regulator